MKALLNKILFNFGYSLRWYPPSLLRQRDRKLQIEFHHAAACLMLQKKEVYFIGIGANDGVTHEPLYPFIRDHGWKGVMVEPIPIAFEKLQQNLNQFAGVSLVNAAIGEQDGEALIYTVDPSSPNASKMSLHSSFDKSVLLAGARWNKDLESYVHSEKVTVIKFQSLMNVQKLPRVDVLKIDTEGYDLKILKSVDFSIIKPSIILAEHANLTREDKIDMCQLLLDNGYNIAMSDLDMLACRSEMI